MNLFLGCGGASWYSYGLFISHAWDYNDDYEGVKRLLNGDSGFRWNDLSVPFNDPLDGSTAFPRSYGAIVDQLRDRIREADALVVIAGMYCAHRGWIQTELEAAKLYGKPIIAVRPLGQERLPVVISEADIDVGWRTSSLVDEIRRLVIPKPPQVVHPNALMGPVAERIVTSMLGPELVGLNALVRPPAPSPSNIGLAQMLLNAKPSGGDSNNSQGSHPHPNIFSDKFGGR